MEMYGVKILFKNTVTGQPTVTDESYSDMYVYYEESIRVFMAESFEQAEEKAIESAKYSESQYKNVYGQTVDYKFHSVVNSFIIDDLQDGDEIFAQTYKITKSAHKENSISICTTLEDTAVLREEIN
ncbi:MAG: DUF4288 domain-containing protein [Clostridia bacterium]|nr:DUF4288 domain-containing protein [Clostridia bacterium]